jgi:hypothetical protein
MREQSKFAKWLGTALLAAFVVAFFFSLWVFSLRHAAETLGDAMAFF